MLIESLQVIACGITGAAIGTTVTKIANGSIISGTLISAMLSMDMFALIEVLRGMH